MTSTSDLLVHQLAAAIRTEEAALTSFRALGEDRPEEDPKYRRWLAAKTAYLDAARVRSRVEFEIKKAVKKTATKNALGTCQACGRHPARHVVRMGRDVLSTDAPSDEDVAVCTACYERDVKGYEDE